MAAKWIRVRDTSGHEVSVRGDVPEGHPRGLQPGQRVLKKPAADRGGEPLEPKYRLPLGEPLPGGKTARKRAARKRASNSPVPAATKASENNDGRPAETDKEK